MKKKVVKMTVSFIKVAFIHGLKCFLIKLLKLYRFHENSKLKVFNYFYHCEIKSAQ